MISSYHRRIYYKARRILDASRYYIYTQFITNFPSYFCRKAYLRFILRLEIGKQTSIQMGLYLNGPHVKIGNHSVINRNCHMDGRVGVEIGDCVSISQETMVLSMTHDPQDANFATFYRKVTIEDFVWIGARALILPGVTLGRGCVVGAGAVVTKSVAAYDIVAGVPAKKIGVRTRDLQYHQLTYFPYFDTDIV